MGPFFIGEFKEQEYKAWEKEKKKVAQMVSNGNQLCKISKLRSLRGEKWPGSLSSQWLAMC